MAFNEPARVAEPVPAAEGDDDADDDVDDKDFDDDDVDDTDFDDDDADDGSDDDDDEESADEGARPVGVLAVLRDSSGYGMIGLLSGGDATALSIDPSTVAMGRGPTPSLTPTVALLAPQVSDAGFQPIVVRVVRSHVPLLRACYAQALSAAPALRGTVTVAFSVDASGVQNPSASSSGLSAVHPCVERVFAGLVLPSPGKDSVRVSYPIQLTPPKAAP